jgi:ADP-ribose pyrophosphatase YjhB (NUDIX family)
MRLREVLPDHKRFKVCDQCGYVDFSGPKLVAGCLVIEQGKVLLLRRGIAPRIGKWTFPGGYVDLGETPESAAIRETREEVGLQVRLGPMLGLFSDPADPVAAVAVYFAELISGTPSLSEEATEVRFFGPDELPWDDLAFHTTESALKAWVESVESD